MSANRHTEPVVTRLQEALENQQFPSEWQQWGSRLLDHLKKPVQIAVLGMSGTGKSTLINMMLGASVIPRVEGIPVIEVAHGRRTRAVFELQDGSSVRRNGDLAGQELPSDAVRARIELPMDPLIRQNFVEVGLNGDLRHQASMVNWVVQWADVILWCTDDFGETEQKLWGGVPDDIKDHSFLILTMADRQMMRGVLQDRISSLEEVVSEEFLCLYPIATEQAITARTAGQELNEALWKSSGGKQLLEGVLRQVESGRTADVDQAQMLLNRFAPVVESVDTPDANEISTAAKAPGATQGARAAEMVLSDALKLLQDCANQMLAGFSSGTPPKPEEILEQCVTTVNQLSDMMADIDADEFAACDVRTDAQESAEMMLLFQLEKDEDAAVDAVTLLLQLKKEIARKTLPDSP